MKNNENALKVKNLYKFFWVFKKDFHRLIWVFTKKKVDKEIKVLNGLNFELKKGEVVGILGKNGAGKSTLLKIISGIYFPTMGDIEANGKIASLIELGAGFENSMTGRQNIYIKGQLMGLTEAEIDSKIDSIIKFADIGDYIDMPYKTYSSGMGARLGFALAVNIDPDILIIDEVFSVGDANFAEKSRRKTEEFFDAGKTILLVSHSESQIQKFCTRVIYLKDGKVFFDGDVDEGLGIFMNDQLNPFYDQEIADKIISNLAKNRASMEGADDVVVDIESTEEKKSKYTSKTNYVDALENTKIVDDIEMFTLRFKYHFNDDENKKDVFLTKPPIARVIDLEENEIKIEHSKVELSNGGDFLLSLPVNFIKKDEKYTFEVHTSADDDHFNSPWSKLWTSAPPQLISTNIVDDIVIDVIANKPIIRFKK